VLGETRIEHREIRLDEILRRQVVLEHFFEKELRLADHRGLSSSSYSG